MSESVGAILEKGNDPDAVYSAQEIATIRPLALSTLPPVEPAPESHVNRCLASMAHMPQKEGGITGGRLQLQVYLRMLAPFPVEAINYATQTCLRTLQFFPSVRELVNHCEDWTDPRQYAINRARRILNTGKRIPKETPPLTQEEIDAMDPKFVALGLKIGAIVEMDGRFVPPPAQQSNGTQKGMD